MDVGDWLRGLGLGQYEDVFRENEIGADVLPDLTDADLEKLNVPLGNRKRLLKAIAALDRAGGNPSAPAIDVAVPSVETAERRQLTVMFCDLVGSTAMSARLDPEDMRGIIAAYHRCCAKLITGSGGFVAKYMGDGVLAYFGYPQAHEHDAEHAVRAGLAIVEAAPKLETLAGAPLHVRVGIATGIVVVGDLLGSGEAQERGVVGDTPNLAARLQNIAATDSVVIGEGTRKLLGDLFELRDLGPQDLKGVAGPTRAYVALSESSRESRFDALHAEGLTALVGREEETDLLLRRWSKAKAGEGQVVLLSGEAGIGKSRLAAEFLQRLSGEPHQRLRYFCSPQHTDSALYPIIAHLERAAGLAREDDPKTKLDKLEARLATPPTSREDVALLAAMLSLPNDGRYPAIDLAPAQRRQKTLEALIAQIDAIAGQTPTLMIFEDAHWADPSSLEVLSQLVDTVQAMRALLFVTLRPEFAAPWVARPHVTTLSINRLTRRDVEALIERVAGNKRLPPGVQQDIVERADGVPLFVEEMTKAVLEAESEGEAARAMASIPSSALAVPASLHASLMARLDRLGNAKAVAQIGAAIGREFSHDLLAAVAGETEAELVTSLDRLVDAGLLYRRGSAPHATYLFKHALVQDTAYGTLLREPRRALHCRIASALESRFPEVADNQPELLARHFADAGMIEKAASLWGRAGQKSLERSANVEAESQFRRALEVIAALPGESRQRRVQIDLQVGLAKALMYTRGFASPETKAAFRANAPVCRARRGVGRVARGSTGCVFRAVRFLLGELCGVQRGRRARSRGGMPVAGAEARRRHPARDRAWLAWRRIGRVRRFPGRPGPSRSRGGAVRSRGARSAVFNKIWPGLCAVFDFSVLRALGARPSGGRPCRYRAGARGCAQDWPRHHPDGGAAPHGDDTAPPGRDRRREGASRRTRRAGGGKVGAGSIGARDGGPELRAGLERRDLEGRAIVRAGDRLRPVSRIDGRDSLPVVRSGEGSRGPWAIRRRPALHRRSHRVGGGVGRKVVGGRVSSHGRRDRADVARAQRREGANLFRTRA